MRSFALFAAATLAIAAGKFWDDKPVDQWSIEELDQFFSNSPWARDASDTGRSLEKGASSVVMFLASAKPAQLADAERRRRMVRRGASDSSFEEYISYLAQNDGRVLILAVPLKRNDRLSDSGELNMMEKRSEMRAGGKTYPLLTYFPPTSTDDHLRLAFPRPANPGRRIEFSVYVPGIPSPFRMVDFSVKDLTWQGKIEY
jgi:hypothetical protein